MTGIMNNPALAAPGGPSLPADLILGITLLLCSAIGIPANLLSFKFFLGKNKDLPTCIYILTTITDTAICLACLAPGLSYLTGRDPWMFASHAFCVAWGVFIAVFPAATTFVVSLLSITRSYNLHYPLRPLERHTSLALIGGYSVFLVRK